MVSEANLTRKEVEAKLAIVGDYVKMDYLQACLKKPLDFDTKKFVLVKLAEIYDSKKMFLEAGKMMRNAAEINTTYEGKMQDFMKSFEMLVKGGFFDEAEVSFTKALICATELQKKRIKARKKEMYLAQAQEFLKKDKRKHAVETFERILEMPDLLPNERQEVQKNLLDLYEKLGKIREYYNLKKGANKPLPQTKTQEQNLKESKESSENLFRELGI